MPHTPEPAAQTRAIKARVTVIGLIPGIALVLVGAAVVLTATAIGGAVIVALGVFVVLAVLHQTALVNDRLTQLRQDVLNLADRSVPDVERRLLAGEHVDIDAEVPWLHEGTDEIGQLAAAVNRAERMAIAATLQESETRRGAREVFLNIAHRNQVIVHRQLATLDQAEQSEDNPEHLELLFQLDHLATRSRRNAENLVILNGGKPGRRWRNPVPLQKIVAGAVAETEHYTRIDTTRIPETPMAGRVVTDLAHLLAELVDNATSFSPPHTRVEVRGNLVAKGVAVKIEDQGLGLDPEYLDQVNATLRTPQDFGVTSLSGDSRLGMFVVAQLAARHGIQVTLQESAYGGTAAVVLIPASLIAASLPPEQDTSNAPQDTDVLTTAVHDEPPQQPVIPYTETVTPDSDEKFPSSPDPDSPQAGGKLQRDAGDCSSETTAVGERGPACSEARSSAPASGFPDAQAVSNGDERVSPTETTGSAAVRTDEDKPPLPQRQRQANLAPQLWDDAPTQDRDPDGDSGCRAAEYARITMTAFQRGTLDARDSETVLTGAHLSGEHHDDQRHSD